MYKFGKYTLRPAREEDREDLAARIDDEPNEDHRTRVSPDFFLAPGLGSDKFVLEDEQGRIFYFRMDRVIRIHVQFGVTESDEEKQRLRAAIEDGFGWLKAMASKAGILEVLFDTTGRELANFCKRRIGFKDSPNELKLVIPPPVPDESLENPVRVEHHKV